MDTLTIPVLDNRVTLAKLKVMQDFIVVSPLAPPTKKIGGLMFMPETAGERERSQRGVMVATGPGDWNDPGTALIPMALQVGDLVYFGKYSGTSEEFDGREVLVMREREVRLAVSEGRYELVTHPDLPKGDHLVEDWCEVCHGAPAEEAAKSNLAEMREELVRTGKVSELVAVDPPADRTDAIQQVLDVAFPGTLEPPKVQLVSGLRRPCVHAEALPDGSERPCRYMQTQVDTSGGWMWVGVLCGHVTL